MRQLDLIQQGRANVIIDGQWGSTGKGKLAGWLASHFDFNLITADFQPNAGHTVVLDDGKVVVNKQIPTSAVVNQDATVVINAGAAIVPHILLREAEEANCISRLMIHPNAAVVTPEDALFEQENCLDEISSTKQGGAAAHIRKMMRPTSPRAVTIAADSPDLAPFIVDTGSVTRASIRRGGTVLVETAQGFDLSLNHGHQYPYCTSRDVTTASAMNNAAIALRFLGSVIGSIRAHPIRVGNMKIAPGEEYTSGPFYSDHEEITWARVRELSGGDAVQPETTTVTKKIRRVFSFSRKQLFRFMDVCWPTHLFLNFANYIDAKVAGAIIVDQITEPVNHFIKYIHDEMAAEYGFEEFPPVALVGTGARNSEMVVY